MRRLTGTALLAAAVIAAALLFRPTNTPPAAATPAATPATTPATAPGTTPGATRPTPGTPFPATRPTPPDPAAIDRSNPAPTPPAARHSPAAGPATPPSGQALADRWLRGYLTRPTRDDTSWAATIAPLTAPDLLSQLEAAGPDSIGATRLQTWRVAMITPYTGAGTPVDAPSRMVLTYSATLTDGQHTLTKPFELTAYLAADGRWLVTDITQPYSSEG